MFSSNGFWQFLGQLVCNVIIKQGQRDSIRSAKLVSFLFTRVSFPILPLCTSLLYQRTPLGGALGGHEEFHAQGSRHI